MLDRPPSPPPTGTNTANIDPCYQTPRSLPPLTTTINVLPTISEVQHVHFALETEEEDSSSSPHGRFRLGRIKPSLDGLPLPLFVPGPGGSWIWKDPHRAPTSVWDLVVKTPTFVPVPVVEEKVEISAEYRAMLDRPPSPPPTGTNTTNIDPCYQTPRSLPPLTTTIDVLPTIPEKRHVRFTPETKREDGSQASSQGGFRHRRVKDNRQGGHAGENE